MPTCPSCGAERVASATAGAACVRCGASAGASAPDFELDVPKRAPPRQGVSPAKEREVERPLELAIDLHALASPVDAPPAEALSGTGSAPEARSLARAGGTGDPEPPRRLARLAEPEPALALRGTGGPIVGDVAFDATLLAEYGDPPTHWLFAPFYAWRVLRRQRELKKVLAGRREEAARAAHEVEDALVAFAERVRPAAEKRPEFGEMVEELRAAEEVLRSRDRVLATEQDAQSARLASVDARLVKLEADLAHAQSNERAIASEMASAQAALARGETKLKRAESELRSAQQHEADGART
jgi:hypothetical protein